MENAIFIATLLVISFGLIAFLTRHDNPQEKKGKQAHGKPDFQEHADGGPPQPDRVLNARQKAAGKKLNYFRNSILLKKALTAAMFSF